MAKCLVTKLKASVEDETLLKVGEVLYEIHHVDGADTGNDRKLGFDVPIGETVTITAVGDMNIYEKTDTECTNPLKAITYTGYISNMKPVYIIADNKDGYVKVDNRYRCDGIFRLTDTEYQTVSVNIDQYAFANIKRVYFPKGSKQTFPALTGSTKTIGKWLNVTQLDISYSDIVGDIKDLGPCVNLQKNVRFYGTSIYGKIEEFVKSQIAYGRTSVDWKDSSVSINMIPSINMTFGEHQMNISYDCVLGWDSENHMVLSCTKMKVAYIVNATSEDINYFEGYNIIDVHI